MEVLRITNKITNRQCLSFKRYLTEISEIKMFATPEDEANCALKASKGDKDAINELIERNLRFVVSVAKQYEMVSVPLEDLVNEGNIGLMMAVSKYNPDRGFKFITYAVFWIRKCILEYLTNNGRIIRIPANKVTNLSKYNEKVNNMEQTLGHDVDVAEIMKSLSDNMSDGEIKELGNILAMNIDSLDNTISNGDTNTTMYEMIADTNLKPTDYLVNDSDTKIEVQTILGTLKERDRQIMIYLFGLDGNAPLTLKEVGEKVGLTREMVRQIKEKSLRALKIAYTN